MPHICIATTPALRMETRAHVQTGVGKSSDDVATKTKNPYLVTFEEWKACFAYTPGKDWSLAKDGAAAAAMRKRLHARLRKLDAWSGQIFVLGHSQGFEHVCVGGFAATKTVPDHHHGLVSGAELGKLLRAVLPLERAPVVDVVLLVPWLGQHSDARAAAFLSSLLGALGAPTVRALVHATPYETWPSPWDDIHVNGARLDRAEPGSVHADPLASVRAAALEHAAKGTIGARAVAAELERDLRRVVERQVLHPVGVGVRTLDDVALVTHLAQRGAEAFEEHRAFASFYLDASKALAVDRTLTVYGEHRAAAIATAARVAEASVGAARSTSAGDDADAPPSTVDAASTVAKGAKASPGSAVDVEVHRPANTLARPTEEPKPSRGVGGAKGAATELSGATPRDDEAGFEKVDYWDWSSVRRKRPPVSPGNHALQTVEGFNEVPQRPQDDDRQQAREVPVEGPFMQKHAWQRERSFWESKVVEVDGPHAAPYPRRFNQFMRDHDETDPGHVTLPIRDWELEVKPAVKKERRREPPEGFDDAPKPPPAKQDPAWVPGAIAVAVKGGVPLRVEEEVQRAVTRRLCKGVDEAAVLAAATKLATETERLLCEAAAAKQGAAPIAQVDVRLAAFDAETIRRAVNAQVSGFENEGVAERAITAHLLAFAESLGAELKGVSFSAIVRGSRPKSSEPAQAGAPVQEASGTGLTELSSAFFSYTSKDAASNDAPDPGVRANALLDDPTFKRVFRSGPNDYFKVAQHVANALSKEKQRLEIRVYHHPDRRAVGEQRAAALKKLWEHEQKLKGGGQEETFSKKAWLKTVAITIRYIPRTDPKQTNIITFAVGGREAPKLASPAKPAAPPAAVVWDTSEMTLDARWACCTVAHGAPEPKSKPTPEPEREPPPSSPAETPEAPRPTDPEEPDVRERPDPKRQGRDEKAGEAEPASPTELEPKPPPVAVDPPVVVRPRIAPFSPPAIPIVPIQPFEPPIVVHEDPAWVPGALAMNVDGDVATVALDEAKRAIAGRVCAGVDEGAVAAAVAKLATSAERALRDEAAAKQGAEPSAHVALRLTAFDAEAIRRAVGAAVSGFANEAAAAKVIASELASFVSSLGAEVQGLSLEATAKGTRAKAAAASPVASGAAGADDGLTELSSAFFSYTSKDAFSKEAPDPGVRANALLNDPTFKRVFRSGPNDYFKVAQHVANALSKEKQRLEIRVYHHPDRRAVGEQRAAALKKLWEHEQKLKGGGQEETFSKKAWLKTVAITIRYIPRTDPKQTNIITFAVGGHAKADATRAKASDAPMPITWDASSVNVEARWACCTEAAPVATRASGAAPKATGPAPTKATTRGIPSVKPSGVRGR